MSPGCLEWRCGGPAGCPGTGCKQIRRLITHAHRGSDAPFTNPIQLRALQTPFFCDFCIFKNFSLGNEIQEWIFF
jgi:hypothetical protein